MLEQNHDQLWERLQADDQGALQTIFHHHYPTVYHAILRIAGDENMAEDLAQEVFVRLWERRHQIQISGALGGYLRRMAINEALGYLRKQKKYTTTEIQEQHSPAISSGEDTYLHGELADQVRVAINSLPPRCKTVFVLSRFEELSYKEIGEKLDISPKTVENQISKALKMLRAALNGYLTALICWVGYW